MSLSTSQKQAVPSATGSHRRSGSRTTAELAALFSNLRTDERPAFGTHVCTGCKKPVSGAAQDCIRCGRSVWFTSGDAAPSSVSQKQAERPREPSFALQASSAQIDVGAKRPSFELNRSTTGHSQAGASASGQSKGKGDQDELLFPMDPSDDEQKK